jgi:hypothetical protein
MLPEGAERRQGRTVMLLRGAFGLLALLLVPAAAAAADGGTYPDWKGQWRSIQRGGGNPPFDPSKPPGRGQEAPLTPEYQAIFEAGRADQATGGQGNAATYTCLPPGMPRTMTAYGPMEIVITPDTTYILIEYIHDNRRVFTDGRDWPADIEPSFTGYSIGKWIDSAGDGRFDVLEVETRALKGPRSYDASGLPLHKDNQTIVKERIFLDKSDKNLLHDEMTVIDHALTRPWVVTKNYARILDPHPFWREYVCAENNSHVQIGREVYYLSADGLLMPAKKDQAPPDLRYFNQTRK